MTERVNKPTELEVAIALAVCIVIFTMGALIGLAVGINLGRWI